MGDFRRLPANALGLAFDLERKHRYRQPAPDMAGRPDLDQRVRDAAHHPRGSGRDVGCRPGTIFPPVPQRRRAVAGGLHGTSRLGRRAIDARSLLDSVGFVSAATLAAAASIVDSPEPRIWLAGRDRVYLGLGMGEVAVGDRLSVFRHVEAIRDLRTRRLLGHHVGILGWLEVVEVQGDSSVAEIQVSVAEMARGDHVTPRVAWPEPILPAPTASVVAGQIVFLPAPRSVMGTADSVYVDRGSNHGLRVGSELEIVEGGRAVVDSVRGSSVRTPTRVIGGLVVLATQPESALAVVTHVRRELELGDAVRSPPPEELAGR